MNTMRKNTEYIGNLENCRLYREEDGTIYANMIGTCVRKPPAQSEIGVLLKGMRLALTVWVRGIGFFILVLLLAATPELRTQFSRMVLLRLSIFPMVLSSAIYIGQGAINNDRTWASDCGYILGQIVSFALLYFSADWILQFNYQTLIFVPIYAVPIIVLKFAEWMILVPAWKSANEDNERALCQYGWISFPKISDPKSQTASEET